MTRARRFLLALLAGVASIPALARAQAPYVVSGGSPVVGPYGTPAPLAGVDAWDECVANLPVRDEGAYGPLACTDGGFLRAEYLNWNFSDPKNTLLGAPVAGIGNPAAQFPVFEPGTNNIIAVTSVPTTTPMGLNDISGIRVTGGVDLTYGGAIEVSAFMTRVKETGFVVGQDQFSQLHFVTNPGEPLSGHLVPTTVSTSVLQFGQISDNLLLYNQSYTATLQSQMWGGEANWIGDFDRVGFIWCNPILGVRYFNLHERLTQTGIFQDNTILAPAIVSTIDSVTYNNLYGPQAGARLEMMTKFIQLGLESKLMFLTNTMLASVATNRLRSNADPYVKTDDLTTQFSFGVDIGTYGAINITEHLSIRVGYNFYWFDRVTRPESNIYYNDNGPVAPPGFVTNLTTQNFIVHGVSVGGDLRF
ncbi:MAG: BBP7 family outer membrane beta-barrel protein [Planctomycetaceae bacterium]